MKIILKFLQFIFKSLATIFSKLGAQYTYNKLFKYLMKYKFIFIIWKPLKYIFNNFILFIKLSSLIIAIFSLFNFSIIYYDYDILEHINDLISKIINYIKTLYNKWLYNEDDKEITEPIDFLHYRKKIKVIDKTIQQSPSNSYWIFPLILIGYGAIYYYNSEIMEILDPIINKTGNNLPDETISVFIIGTFIYKGIIFSITHITGYDLNIFTNDDNQPNDDSPMDHYFKDEDELDNPPQLLTDTERRELENYQRNIINEWRSEDNINEPNESLQDNEQTPRLRSTNLPIETPRAGRSPYERVRIQQIDTNSVEIRTEEWI